MICPKDATQLVQYNKQGSGASDESYYHTMEVKICPTCKSKYLEAYCTFELGQDNLADSMLRFTNDARILSMRNTNDE